MKNFFNIMESDLGEIMIDTEAYYQNISENQSYTSDYGGKYGIFAISSKKKSDIYISNFKVQFNRDVRIFTESYPSLIGLYFNKKGYCHQKIYRREKEFHKFGNQECGLYFMNEGDYGESLYKENLPIEFVGFHFLPDFFKTLAERYPQILASYYKEYEKGRSFSLTSQTLPITLPMHQILNQIDHADMFGNSSSMYLEAKVLELLSLMFQSVDRSPLIKETVQIKTVRDKEKIYEAKHILLSNLSDTPSIRELSLEVGVNEKKLKKGFKEVFGTTVYGCLFEHKMQLAKQFLLDTNLSIKEVAHRCGYEYASHFSTAFKRYYGCTPLEMRRVNL